MKTALLSLILCAALGIALCGCKPLDGYGDYQIHVGDRILLQPRTGVLHLSPDGRPFETTVTVIRPHVGSGPSGFNALFQANDAAGKPQWWEESDVSIEHL